MTATVHGGPLVAGIEVRVLTRERHNLTSQATEYCLEDGSSLSDHVKLNPNAVDVHYGMTNTDRGIERARQVFQDFVKMREARQPLTIETEHARYKNMVLVGNHPDHSAPFKGAYMAVARFVQVGYIGLSDMVEAAGGRSTGANDGTSKTGSAFTSGGMCNPGTNASTLSACQASLRGQ